MSACALAVVPPCWMRHRTYDTGRLELLPDPEPRWQAEVAYAVLHLGLIGDYRRLGRRWGGLSTSGEPVDRRRRANP